MLKAFLFDMELVTPFATWLTIFVGIVTLCDSLTKNNPDKNKNKDNNNAE